MTRILALPGEDRQENLEVPVYPCGFQLTHCEKTSNRAFLGQSIVPALNFPQFGRILYMQTNLSAALCAIRSGGERSGLTAHFFFGPNLGGNWQGERT